MQSSQQDGVAKGCKVEKHSKNMLNKRMIRQSVYDAYDAQPAPKKSYQAFLVDQLELCVELLSGIKQSGVHDENGNCILLAVRRLSGPDDPGPSYSLFYEDTQTRRLANLDYPLSVVLGARLNHDRSGVCVPEAPEAFQNNVTQTLNAFFGADDASIANPFIVNWL